MKPIKLLMALAVLAISAKAQNATPAPTTEPFGKVSTADLGMKACDFEKDANAEILFDQGNVYFDANYNLIFIRHIRIKIFNEKAKDEGNVRIEYYGGNGAEYINNVQAETMNLNNGKVEIIKIDKKQIFTQKIDKQRTALIFSFPNVQAGSVIEYKYSMTTSSVGDFPDWYFQSHLPTRYSELKTAIPHILNYKNLEMVNQPYVKRTDEIKAMANIPSLQNEPYMSSRKDNEQRILYQLLSVDAGAGSQSFQNSWKKVGDAELDYDDFGSQFKRKIPGEEVILTKAKTFTQQKDKIAYIFNEVKNSMKWNEENERYTDEGTAEAWTKKIGNSTEINLILYHLLHKAGLNAYPMLVSTRNNGKANPAYPSKYQFNKTVAYIPVDSTTHYVLDATNKYNIYSETPVGLLNGYGFCIDNENKNHKLVFLQKTEPVRQVVLINAEIKSTGKMNGTAQLNSFSYYRSKVAEKYKTDGETKYIDYLRDGDNSLKISDLKLKNLEIDTLPLTQDLNFNLELTGSDDNYIYFSPNLFTNLHRNPFLSENRSTDIDFSYRSNYAIYGIYKLPAGYKIDALPKSASMTMPDNSIIFKRMVAEQGGSVMVRYTIIYKNALYFKENYSDIHDFYKKMHEMLNEQIVLKKG